MRKEINSKSKRKWVAGGLAAFASVALLTTGFATWVVINSSTNKDNSVTVNVDTAQNTSVRMTFEVEGTLTLQESNETAKSVTNPTVIGTKKGDVFTDNPLVITIKTFTIKFGANADLNSYKKLNFSIAKAGTKDKNVDNLVDSKNNLLADYRTKDGSFTYFDAPESITVDLNNSSRISSGTDGTSIWTYDGSTSLSFKWGTFFGGKSPIQILQ